MATWHATRLGHHYIYAQLLCNFGLTIYCSMKETLLVVKWIHITNERGHYQKLVSSHQDLDITSNAEKSANPPPESAAAPNGSSGVAPEPGGEREGVGGLGSFLATSE